MLTKQDGQGKLDGFSITSQVLNSISGESEFQTEVNKIPLAGQRSLGSGDFVDRKPKSFSDNEIRQGLSYPSSRVF